jgi:homoserine O-succinyltransferase
MFGVFSHRPLIPTHPLLRGFDEAFWAPHSRHTEVRREDIEKVPDIELLSTSDEAGVYIAANKDGRQIFVTGHSEYDRNTLAGEYFRDFDKGLDIKMPRHYFPDDNPLLMPPLKWSSHANLLYTNWLNYFVYQKTPFDLTSL